MPDFLSGKGKDGGGTKSFGNDVGQAIRNLAEEEVCARLDAAVVFYVDVPGASKDVVPQEAIARIEARVLGRYGGNDARINGTLPPTIAAMMEHKKR